MNKSALRKIYRQKRAALHAGEREKLQDLCLIRFQQMTTEIPGYLMHYAAFADEFDPGILADYCHFRNPGLVEGLPVVDPEKDEMHCREINEHTVYTINKYGIPEPENGFLLEPGMIDMVIIPLLCFDERGFRVGYGKGYYDRFLVHCRKDVIKIGCSFFDPVEQISDVGDHDIKLDYCIPPHQIYSFNN